MSAGYWELDLDAPPDAAEGLANFLWESGALGVTEESAPGTAGRLRAFFPATADPSALERATREYMDGLRALGLEVRHDVRIRDLADGNWAEAWREHFRPLAVGRALLVVPPWEAKGRVPPGRLQIVIEPGRAFGTGHHATTAGCLERLEAIVARIRPRAALDLGAGSGILAIAAARLGVARVLAVDDDPDAVAAADANARRNAVHDRVHCLRADAGGLVVEPMGLVLANLLPAAHLRLATDYARYVAPGGALVLGGIPAGEAGRVRAALTGRGFRPASTRTHDGWTTLELRRAARAPAGPRRPWHAALRDRA